jgi:hypothetical protein
MLRGRETIAEHSTIRDYTSQSGVELATKQMASYTTSWYYGFISIYLIMIRIPLFLPFIPLLYFLKITKLGQLFYMQLAVNRNIIPLHCSIDGCVIEK